MSTPNPSFSEFEAQAKAEGYDEVLARDWPPNAIATEHQHPFTACALVVQGEMWLTVGDRVQHLRPGDRFEIQRNTPHNERYGAEGATYWVARRNPA